MMVEETSDETAMLDGMEPESGDMLKNSNVTVEEGGDKNIDQGEMEHNFVTDENTNRLEDNKTDAKDELDEGMSLKSIDQGEIERSFVTDENTNRLEDNKSDAKDEPDEDASLKSIDQGEMKSSFVTDENANTLDDNKSDAKDEPGEDVSLKSIDQGETEHSFVTDENANRLEDNTSDAKDEPGEDVSLKGIHQGGMERSFVTDENTNRLDGNTSDAKDEPGEGVSPKSQIPDAMIGQTSTYVVIDSSVPLKRSSSEVTVRSRYRRISIASCHDLCKSGHKHDLGKVTKKPVLGTIRESRPSPLIRTVSGGDNREKYVPEKEMKKKAPRRRLSFPGPMAEKDLKIITECTTPKRIAPIPSRLKQVQSERKACSVSTPRKSINGSKTEVFVKKTWLVKSSQKVEEMKVKEASSSNASGKVKAKESMSASSKTPLKKSPSIKATLYRNLKSLSRSVRQSYSDDAKIKKSGNMPEKAVYVIKSNANNSEKALKSSHSTDEPPSIPRDSSFGKAKKSNGTKKGTRSGGPSINNKEIGTATEEDGSRKKMKRDGISPRAEKDGSSWKVIFRRGTVVNPQTANNSSRKLRFKRGRILDEDQNANVEAKNLKSKDVMTNELPATKPEAEKIRLRQQEASAKKDSIDLNNVIEETASKLVKTRKSKVKALVGAFETVMSFRERDREPLAGTSAS